jgi:hypothetical protein
MTSGEIDNRKALLGRRLRLTGLAAARRMATALPKIGSAASSDNRISRVLDCQGKSGENPVLCRNGLWSPPRSPNTCLQPEP